jgi:hypothetical protein
MTAHECRFYTVNGNLVYGVPGDDVIWDELGAPPAPTLAPASVRFTREWLHKRPRRELRIDFLNAAGWVTLAGSITVYLGLALGRVFL